MKLFNKKGLSGGVLAIIIIFVLTLLIALVFFLRNNYSDHPSIPISEVYDNANLNFLNYIIGDVPGLLIGGVGKYSAAIIMILFSILFMITFADILFSFSLFTKPTAVVIGIILGLITVNIKLVTYLATFFLLLAAPLGAFSVAVGIAVPFILFMFLNFALFKVGFALQKAKDAREFNKAKLGANRLAQNVEVLSDVAAGVANVAKKGKK